MKTVRELTDALGWPDQPLWAVMMADEPSRGHRTNGYAVLVTTDEEIADEIARRLHSYDPSISYGVAPVSELAAEVSGPLARGE